MVSSALSGIGLYWLGSLDTNTSWVVALTAATLFLVSLVFGPARGLLMRRAPLSPPADGPDGLGVAEAGL